MAVLKKTDEVRFRHDGQVLTGRVAQLNGNFVLIAHAKGLTQVARDTIVSTHFDALFKKFGFGFVPKSDDLVENI